VRRAMELWQEAEAEIAEGENRAEYLRGLFQAVDGKAVPIFTDSPRDWAARLKAYPGDERDVERALWSKAFPAELVEKRLFKDKSLTKAQRHRFLLGLARACIRFGMEGPRIATKGRPEYLGGQLIPEQEGFPIHPENLQIAEKSQPHGGKRLIPSREVEFVRQVEALLSEPSLYAHLVRWAVEVRQRVWLMPKSAIFLRVCGRSLKDRTRNNAFSSSGSLASKVARR